MDDIAKNIMDEADSFSEAPEIPALSPVPSSLKGHNLTGSLSSIGSWADFQDALDEEMSSGSTTKAAHSTDETDDKQVLDKQVDDKPICDTSSVQSTSSLGTHFECETDSNEEHTVIISPPLIYISPDGTRDRDDIMSVSRGSNTFLSDLDNTKLDDSGFHVCYYHHRSKIDNRNMKSARSGCKLKCSCDNAHAIAIPLSVFIPESKMDNLPKDSTVYCAFQRINQYIPSSNRRNSELRPEFIFKLRKFVKGNVPSEWKHTFDDCVSRYRKFIKFSTLKKNKSKNKNKSKTKQTKRRINNKNKTTYVGISGAPSRSIIKTTINPNSRKSWASIAAAPLLTDQNKHDNKTDVKDTPKTKTIHKKELDPNVFYEPPEEVKEDDKESGYTTIKDPTVLRAILEFHNADDELNLYTLDISYSTEDGSVNISMHNSLRNNKTAGTLVDISSYSTLTKKIIKLRDIVVDYAERKCISNSIIKISIEKNWPNINNKLRIFRV